MATTIRQKWALAGLSGLASLGLAAVLYTQRPAHGSAGDIDRQAEKADTVTRLLRERSAASAGDAAAPVLSGVLRRGPIPREDAELLFPSAMSGRWVYDPTCHFRYKANRSHRVEFDEHPDGGFRVVTNSAGFLKSEPLLEDPELRVLVTGDSHTAGVCDSSENLSAVLEVSLRARRTGSSVEVLNGGCGFYTFYQYLGVLERCLPLEPDVFVVVVFGGNDFLEMSRLRHYFHRTEREKPDRAYWERLKAFHDRVDGAGPWMSQGLSQLFYFAEKPEEERLALEATSLAVGEIVATCRENGIAPVFAYLPPLWDVQLERYHRDPQALRESLGVGPRASTGADPCARLLEAAVEASGAAFVDLRPAFRASDDDLYWRTDHHINVRGHALVAEALVAAVDAAPSSAER